MLQRDFGIRVPTALADADLSRECSTWNTSFPTRAPLLLIHASDFPRFLKTRWTRFVPGRTVSRGTFKRGRRTRHRTVPRGTIVLWLEPVSCKYGSLSSEPSLGISSLGFCST